ncbi:MAG: RDD family protein [Chloroflexi bacterium]|nr:RDD family protein [Chloroflexota bacterium]
MMELNGQPPLGSPLKRLAAILLDGLVPAIIMIPVAAASSVASASLPSMPSDLMLTVLIFLGILTYAGLFSYSAVVLGMWAYGLTPGKWMMGLQVIKIDTGAPVGFWRMALRQIVGQWVSAIVCYLGFLWILFDRNKQGWHDKIAKTLVIATK